MSCSCSLVAGYAAPRGKQVAIMTNAAAGGTRGRAGIERFELAEISAENQAALRKKLTKRRWAIPRCWCRQPEEYRLALAMIADDGVDILYRSCTQALVNPADTPRLGQTLLRQRIKLS